MKPLNTEQNAAATSEAAMTVAIAGPGSGKTTTLIQAIENQASQGVQPGKMVLVTFTNASADELRKRLDNTIGQDFGRRLNYSGTLHSLMLRLVQMHAKRLGFSAGKVTVIDEDQALGLFDISMNEQKWTGTKTEARQAVKAANFWAGQDRTTRMTKADLVAATYFRSLVAGNLIDFDGLLQAGLRLLRAGYPLPGEPTHVYVDEAQDSADIDWQIYDVIKAERKYFTGDPDQSIYGFRGAAVARFVEHATKEPTAAHFTVALESNYRSGMLICAQAQRLIEHNASRFNKRTRSATGTEGRTTVHGHANPTAEAMDIAEQLQKSHAAGIPWEEMAVLTRTNWTMKALAEDLAGRGIPVRKKKFTERPKDWQAARAFVTLLTNPENNTLAMFHVEHITDGVNARTVAHRAAAAMRSINSTTLKLPTGAAPTEAATLAARHGIGPESVELIAAAAGNLAPGAEMTDLALALTSFTEHAPEEGTGVVVSTIHSAKGREWHSVHVASMEQGITPGTRKGTDTEEERRIAYVAFTRAKEQLWLHYCTSRVPQWGEQKPQPQEPSQFITEAST